ncbi:molybdopterin-dependent oxidoreductase alpha subunit [Kushneria sinocarnis]|uniref:Molybdopterin-dependent oxidoreductase alpha subunit n=1 Tax=Kushneria sinocarnis TaxID=595502 RepID=A0A420X1E8_9GAMM|nr:FdhF/YdeP family oxidoreductase [Kushneria sinocarnis]RKR07570.1 molybdopterin-dependent oxidoreductase alpha subunit [Kushneria sinocarnis]
MSKLSDSDLHGEQSERAGPGGGWPSVKATETHFLREHVPWQGNKLMLKMNKPGGFKCPSCAWPDPANPGPAEFCENGAKAVAWEATTARTTPEFFRKHTVTELREWSDHALEKQGRLTHPMRYNATTDKYDPVEWETAFREIGETLSKLDPWDVDLYTSGRASNESAFLWQLFGRMYGTSNFPDCSNMCHETTSRALPESIGVGKATTTLDDFEHADAIFIFGQNTGTNSPRMMGELYEARKRGAAVVTFNPLREKALVKFANPQSPSDMLTNGSEPISSQYHQVRIGGDMAAIQGICKAILAADDLARESGGRRVIDADFIEAHTHGFEAFAEHCRSLSWETIESYSGLTRNALQEAANTWMAAERVICCWGMGITQHINGGDNVQQIVNLLLLGGHIGRTGAGPCPVRGHSNVQGDRTVGVFHESGEPFLAKMDEVFGIHCPREHGRDVSLTTEAVQRDEVRAFLGLGGNFFRAIADDERTAPHVANLDLTVQISTKLNRSHLLHGRAAYILPTKARTERDVQAGVDQALTMEDGMCNIHASKGDLEPASPQLKSEVAIIAGLAQATLPVHPKVDWAWLCEDYARIRDRIEATQPDTFANYNRRLEEEGTFHLYIPARERIWHTDTGRANFLFPGDELKEDESRPGDDHFQLLTTRGHDQFNTTVYSYDDRYRDIYGERMVVMMNPQDIEKHGFEAGNMIEFITVSQDGIERRAAGFRIIAYDIPQGCLGAYYPETNGLIPIANRDRRSGTLAAKSVPVTLRLMDSEELEQQTGKLATA